MQVLVLKTCISMDLIYNSLDDRRVKTFYALSSSLFFFLQRLYRYELPFIRSYVRFLEVLELLYIYTYTKILARKLTTFSLFFFSLNRKSHQDFFFFFEPPFKLWFLHVENFLEDFHLVKDLKILSSVKIIFNDTGINHIQQKIKVKKQKNKF